MSKEKVYNAIKDRVKANVVEIDKVLIICAGRIENVQVSAIKDCMKWLQFDQNREKFSFIYNKSECLSEIEKYKNLTYMCDKLDADLTTRFTDKRSGTSKQTKLNHALGFPRDAEGRHSEYTKITEENLETLMAITLANPKTERIILHTKSIGEGCKIL